MENQPPTTNASAWLNRKPVAPDDTQAEIARLKERLVFYESFDHLIQENVSRASELLRTAASSRENAEQELAQARDEVEELRTADRQEFRALLSGVLDEVVTMQVQIERLARRVTDTLDELEVSLPAGEQVGQLSASIPSTFEMPAFMNDAASGAELEPAPEELAPTETRGEEAEYQAASQPIDEAGAEEEAVAAAAAEQFAPVEPDVVDAIAAEATSEGDGGSEAELTGLPNAQQSDSGTEPASDDTEQPDPALMVDEVVQAPEELSTLTVDDTASSAEEQATTTQAVIDDGVITDDGDAPVAQAGEDEPAPLAAAQEDPAIEATPAEDSQVEASTSEDEAKPPKLPWISNDVRPFSLEGIGSGGRRQGTGELRAPEPAARSNATATSVLQAAEPGFATMLLVHGVPRATTALSLKRYLESLPHVVGVEPREYAEGILRLHVSGSRSLQIDDLRGWSDGGGLEPIHLRDDLIEVRLPH